MAKKLYLMDEATMPNIANAVRRKNGQSTTYMPSDIPAAIDAINTTPAASEPVVATINPGESASVPAGYYEGVSTITASLADTADEIAPSLKTTGSGTTINPGETISIPGGKYYTTENAVTASLADSSDEIDASLKTTGLSLSVRPGKSAVVNGGVFYESDSTVTAAKAVSEGEVDDSIKIAATVYNPSDMDRVIDAGKYTSGIQTIVAVTADNVPASIKEERTVVASLTENKTVVASAGKLMTSVVVNAADMSAATATAENIQLGATAYGSDGTLITGTHVEPTVSDMTQDANAVAGDILLGKTAYAKGAKISGTIQSKTEETFTPSDVVRTISSGQYLSGDQTIEAVTADNVPASIKETKSVTAPLTGSNVVSASAGKLMTSVTVDAPDMSDADAVAGDIALGKKAYVGGALVTGTYVASEGTNTSDATAVAEDIALGKTAYVSGGKVTGTLEFINYSTGADLPLDTDGEDGDIYIVITENNVETAGSINSSTNVISISESLPADTYTLKYEDANNTPLSDWAVIGTVTKSE